MELEVGLGQDNNLFELDPTNITQGQNSINYIIACGLILIDNLTLELVLEFSN